MQRRAFVQKALSASALTALASILPASVFAAWSETAFEAKDVDSAIKAILGSNDISDSADIDIKAPEIAENGAVVPVQVTANLEKVESITVIADKNPSPLIGSFEFDENLEPYVSTRIKMGKTGNVVAIVKADGKLYRAVKQVKVTVGGCGG